jgi:hypothetical protein
MQGQTDPPTASVTIRRLDESDAPALARLVELESEVEFEGPALGAEVEGRLLGAISLVDRRVVSDPFTRTAELRSLLELRARQLESRDRRPRGLRAASRPQSQAALAASPPGAGGRLLALLPRL